MTRKELIKAIEDKRNSKVLCYVTGDRTAIPPNIPPIPGLTTQMATEPQLLIYEHLKAIGKVEKLDLFLYTRGGNTNSVWPLVSLIREFCDKFCVLVPFRAHSAGTMVALGADEIVMSRIAELSPIDPTTANQFNPKIEPQNQKSPPLGISVEDVTSYIKLVREGEPKLKDEKSILAAFEKLATSVHPLALGNVYRVYAQIRQLAKNLLELHMPEGSNTDEIVKFFVEKLYAHDHAINRKEAASVLGDIVKYEEDEELLMWNLYEDISAELELSNPFNVKEFIGNQAEREVSVKGALIESYTKKHLYKAVLKIIQRSVVPPNLQLQVPPGQQIPAIIPGLPTAINIDVVSMGWAEDA